MADTRYQPTADTAIVHYGVKGMRWGVRKDEEAAKAKTAAKQAKRESKALKFEKRAAEYQKQINDIKKTPARNVLQRREQAQDIKSLTKSRDRAMKDAQAKREGKLTRNEKLAIAGVAVVAAYGTYKMVDYGEFNRMSMKGRALFNENGDPFKRNEKLATKGWDVDDIYKNVVKDINPDYGALGTKTNCRRATFAYEMRRRGYDVAATRTPTAAGQNQAGLSNAVTPGQFIGTTQYSVARRFLNEQSGSPGVLSKMGMWGKETIAPNDAGPRGLRVSESDIFSALSKQPDGARGELGVQWGMGGGHSMAWEIVKGKAVIFDTQNGETYSEPKHLFGMDIAAAGFTRLDNLDLNTDYLMRWVKNNG